MPATAKFLHAVAALPQGAVVLPGLDTDLDDDAWQSIGGIRDAQGKFTTPPASNHPQFAMHALLHRFGIKRGDVEILGHAGAARTRRAGLRGDAAVERHRAMASSGWPSRRSSSKISGGMTNLAVIEAANPEMEALAIAVAMREARHLGKSAALVTPDRALARRVMAALGRWNLAFDDSGGDALMDTPAGIFARLAAEAVAQAAGAADLAGAAETSAVPAGRRAGRVQARHRDAGTGAAARHPAAAGQRRPGARFRPLPRSNSQNSGAASLPRCTGSEPQDPAAGQRTRSRAGADRVAADGAGAARKPRSHQSRTILPNWPQRHRDVLMELSRDQHGVAVAFEGPQGSALAAAFDDLLGERQRQAG